MSGNVLLGVLLLGHVLLGGWYCYDINRRCQLLEESLRK
jgi:hypothetical protein